MPIFPSQVTKCFAIVLTQFHYFSLIQQNFVLTFRMVVLYLYWVKKGSPYSTAERRVPKLIPVLAVSLPVMWVINLAVGCQYFPPGLQLPPHCLQPLRGCYQFCCLGVNSTKKYLAFWEHLIPHRWQPIRRKSYTLGFGRLHSSKLGNNQKQSAKEGFKLWFSNSAKYYWWQIPDGCADESGGQSLL